MIAMALACRPDLIIADEPTTALDVIVQAQILTLLTNLVRERQIGLIMISHDLNVLAETCERLAVMYAGRIVELGPSNDLLRDSRHPYTRILSRAFPQTGDPSSRFAPAGLPGEPPDLRADLVGCPFAPRCPEVVEDCRTREVELWSSGPQRTSACIKVLDPPSVPAPRSPRRARPEPPPLSAGTRRPGRYRCLPSPDLRQSRPRSARPQRCLPGPARPCAGPRRRRREPEHRTR